jgi:hypothetical protein
MSVALAPESVAGIDIFQVRRERGDVFIIPYGAPADGKGRYPYTGPRFDSPELEASPENILALRPDCSLFDLPSFDRAAKEADVAAVAEYIYYDPNKEIDTMHCRIAEILKGAAPAPEIPVRLPGKYLYWMFSRHNYLKHCTPLGTETPKLVLLRKEAGGLHYAGVEFTSPFFPAALETLAELRRLLAKGDGASPHARGRAWAWWAAGAAAAVAAFFIARFASKVDYKHDRRLKRLEKLRGDADAGRAPDNARGGTRGDTGNAAP